MLDFLAGQIEPRATVALQSVPTTGCEDPQGVALLSHVGRVLLAVVDTSSTGKLADQDQIRVIETEGHRFESCLAHREACGLPSTSLLLEAAFVLNAVPADAGTAMLAADRRLSSQSLRLGCDRRPQSRRKPRGEPPGDFLAAITVEDNRSEARARLGTCSLFVA
ncbi:MAG: hypothetical protein H0X42_08035 [Solirubrobacterales bacterium]|nr:hypothetical protein [Solirubrobacterales bacterium]